jgi:hypothetical protein
LAQKAERAAVLAEFHSKLASAVVEEMNRHVLLHQGLSSEELASTVARARGCDASAKKHAAAAKSDAKKAAKVAADVWHKFAILEPNPFLSTLFLIVEKSKEKGIKSPEDSSSVDAKEQKFEPNKLCIRLEYTGDVARISFHVTADRKENVCIQICESSLIALVSSDLLIKEASIKQFLSLIEYVTESPGDRARQPKDFWGHNLELRIPASYQQQLKSRSELPPSKYISDLLLRSLQSVRQQNLLGLSLQNLSRPLNLEFNFHQALPTSRFICKFCGVFSEFPALGDNSYQYKEMCCMDHQIHVESNFPLGYVNVTKKKSSLLWNSSETETEISEIQLDPAGEDANPRRSLEFIRKKEAALYLELHVENKFFPFLNCSKSQVEGAASLEAFKNVPPLEGLQKFDEVLAQICDACFQLGSVSLVVRRDSFHLPAHILVCFCFPSSKKLVARECEFSMQIAVPGTGNRIFGQSISIIQRVDVGKKVYGRLSGGDYSQGGEIQASDYRQFFEPEYSPELFGMRNLESETKKRSKNEKRSCFYPVLSFSTQLQRQGQGEESFEFCALHSWDFSEFQTEELAKLLMCQRQLFLHNSDLGISKEQQPYFEYLGALSSSSLQNEKENEKKIHRIISRKSMLEKKIEFLMDEETRKTIQSEYDLAFSSCMELFKIPTERGKVQENVEDPSKMLRVLETFKFFLQHDSHVGARLLGSKCIFDQVWTTCGSFVNLFF